MSKKEIDKISREFSDLDRKDLERAVEKFGIDKVRNFINLIHIEGSGEVLPLFGSGDLYYYFEVYIRCNDIQAVIALVLCQKDPSVTDLEQRRLAEQVTGEACDDDLSDDEEVADDETSSGSREDDETSEDEGKNLQLKRADSVDSLCSIYSLLSADNDNEDRLGISLNLEHEGKFIPGNNIHEQLSRYQNEYREGFYRIDNGVARFGGSFTKIYEKNRTSIIEAQDKARKKIEPTEDGRVRQLYDCIGSRYIVTIKEESNQPNKVYPNFAIAKLSHLKNGKLFSKCISVSREILDGHSEIQIFERARKIIKSWKDKKPDLIILDINSALSMCSDCYTASNDFISEMESI